MIAEPYICIKGDNAGDIQWAFTDEKGVWASPDGLSLLKTHWQTYADFEREKIRHLVGCAVIDISREGYQLTWLSLSEAPGCKSREIRKWYTSKKMTGYTFLQYEQDPEHARLLERAKFLKVVCEKEAVEWLPKSCCTKTYYGMCDRCMTAALLGLYESIQRAMCKCQCEKTACACGRH